MIEMLQVLRQSALFAEPDPSFVEASCWQLERLEEGQQLFGEGDRADGVFLVIWWGSKPSFAANPAPRRPWRSLRSILCAFCPAVLRPCFATAPVCSGSR
jgi:hypothetical protein